MFPLRVALAALLLVLLAPTAALASNGTYMYMMCANPDTGRGTLASDGVFPDGVSMTSTHPNMSTLQGQQRCSGQISHDRGMIIKTNGSYSLPQNAGATFTLRVRDELRFLDAHVWRRVNTWNGMMTAFVRSPDEWLYATPSYDVCEDPNWGCRLKGDHIPFGGPNHAYVGFGHDRMPNGFRWFLRCSWFSCNVNNDNAFALFGAKVALADDSDPSGSLGVGGLGSDDVLRGVEEVAFNVADRQSGVYRYKVLVDGHGTSWSSVDGGRAECRDVNPANGDDYEFGVQKPCAESASSVAYFDTSAVSDGEHNIKLVVEDASGRTTRLMDRDVAVDNVPPPSVLAEPAVSGLARDGSELTVEPGVWDDHGADAEPVVSRVWERCDGSSCAVVEGADSSSLVLDEADVGKRLRVVETALNGEGSTVARSALTDAVVDTPAPRSVALPSVLGTARRGNALVARPGAWDDFGLDGDPVVVRQWQRCWWNGSACADIPGAVGETYTLGDADLNRRVQLVETASNGEGSTQAVSAQTGRVTREDGTLPSNNDGEDNDGDGTVDEPDEPAGGGGGVPPADGTGTNGVGGTPLAGSLGDPGRDGRNGTDGRGSSSSSGSSTHTSSSSSASRTVVGGPNGVGASPHARLVVRFQDASSSRALRVPFGRGAIVTGRLVDEGGRPIRGAAIDVSSVAASRGARRVALPGVSTGEDGRFVFVAGRKSTSSTLRFAYSWERGGPAVAVDTLGLRVLASVRLSVRLRGTLVSYRGSVVSRPLPSAGKLVILQGRVRGRPWQTFASRRASRTGAFRGRYRLKVRNPGRKLQFRARVVAEAGFPFLPGASRAVTRTVR